MHGTLVFSILAVLCLVAPNASAWNCVTHTYICELAGLGNLDCCYADAHQTPSFTRHHCANDSENCAARVSAREYLAMGRPEIAAHLFADSMSLPHWYSFTDADYSRCHESFETAVGRQVQLGGNGTWPVTAVNCHTRDGGVVNLSVDDAYLREIAVYVANEMGNATTTPTPVSQMTTLTPTPFQGETATPIVTATPGPAGPTGCPGAFVLSLLLGAGLLLVR